MLEKMGHQVVTANNGLEAIEVLEKEKVDLILMDVQMPEMDGFEATKIIKQKQRDAGEHTPIVALTAHAMKGYRDRCLKAGMDDYLSKPIKPTDLADVLKRRLSFKAEPPEVIPEENTSSAIIDQKELMDRLGDDGELLKELVAMFLEDLPPLLAELRKAVDQGDFQQIEGVAHKLKGSISNFAAHEAAETAFQLEKAGRSMDMTAAQTGLSKLEIDVDGLCGALTKLSEETER